MGAGSGGYGWECGWVAGTMKENHGTWGMHGRSLSCTALFAAD